MWLGVRKVELMVAKAKREENKRVSLILFVSGIFVMFLFVKSGLAKERPIVRNPFQPPAAVTKKLLQAKMEIVSPLQKYDVESFVLKGIAADRAMVLSPDKEVYIIKKGTKIGKYGEEVVDILKDRVAVKRGNKIIFINFPKE